jgi:arabinofuranosyltransferase
LIARQPDTAHVSDPAESTLLIAAVVATFTYVFLANSWIGDDAFITFRVVDNFVNGYGLRFNPVERVQAYTHPLWMLLLSAAYAVTSDLFYTTLALSYVLCIAAGVVAARFLAGLWRTALFAGLLLSSKAFVDYTSSGLEYPLSFFLLCLFYTRFLRTRPDAAVVSPAGLLWAGLLASLAFLNRSDSILLYAVPLASIVVVNWRAYRARLAVYLGLALAPIVVWLAFSYVYYGFPFPNTYYAKVATGIPRMLQWRQGLAYVFNSVNFDPFTLGLIGVAAAVAVSIRKPLEIAAMASAVLYVLYTVSVGGDFMSGRFFAMPFLIAALVLAANIRRPRAGAAVAAALIAYNLMAPLAPVKTRASYPDGAWEWRLQNGIKDERGHYHQISNVLFYAPFRALPDHVWYRDGLSFRTSSEKVAVHGSIGFFGFTAGPDKYVIDRNALADPLLARLPVSESLYFEFYAGHFFRELPDGYVESRREGRNLLTDSLLHEYYDKLLHVTSGPVFSLARARDIWALNFGRYRRLHELVVQRRRVSVSVPADNERFSTAVGVRNTRGAGTLTSSGAREGYLQMGPHIPLRAGKFTARWIGTTTASFGQPVGSVDVWADGRLIARRAVFQGELPSGGHLLAEITFELDRPSQDVEYRFYAAKDVRTVLERINLESAN